MKSVFIDGQAGTTGLQIVERLAHHEDIKLLEIPNEQRKDAQIKRDYLNQADLVILCLPDAAAKEAVALISNPQVKVLDASTAHRTNPDWTYGLPELAADQRNKIRNARYVCVPGCYPSGFILAVAPLIKAGLIPDNYPVTIQAVSGYSGGGRKLIEKYKAQEELADIDQIWSYRPYSLQLNHKHLPEMQYYTGLAQKPLFVPGVGHYYQGMLVMVPLYGHLLASSTTAAKIVSTWETSYEQSSFIKVFQAGDLSMLDDGFLSPNACNESNQLELMVFGNDDQLLLVARLDNLGKGASGAAVQNLNLMLNIEEHKGLH